MTPLTPARKASLSMTAVLGIAVVVGAGFALFKAHAAPATALRAEPLSRELPAPAAAPATDDSSSVISGSVLESIPASSYTYLRLATANGEIWTAVPTTSVTVGSHVSVENATKMTAFKSSTLKRTFDVIYFGTLGTAADNPPRARFSPSDALDNEDQDLPPGHPDIGAAAVGAVGATNSLPSGHPGIDSGSASPHGPSPGAGASAVPAVPVEPAHGKNARTIAQLFAESGPLTGQKVRVRGQVTKVTPGVQGRTFLHLRDGKPQQGEQATDLVVTSDATPERGQVATFEGTVRSNVDIGIGYRYPILLENAVIIGE